MPQMPMLIESTANPLYSLRNLVRWSFMRIMTPKVVDQIDQSGVGYEFPSQAIITNVLFIYNPLKSLMHRKNEQILCKCNILSRHMGKNTTKITSLSRKNNKSLNQVRYIKGKIKSLVKKPSDVQYQAQVDVQVSNEDQHSKKELMISNIFVFLLE
jgi:hypothetical protein